MNGITLPSTSELPKVMAFSKILFYVLYLRQTAFTTAIIEKRLDFYKLKLVPAIFYQFFIFH